MLALLLETMGIWIAYKEIKQLCLIYAILSYMLTSLAVVDGLVGGGTLFYYLAAALYVSGCFGLCLARDMRRLERMATFAALLS